MIPKIIHYIWFGSKPYTKIIQKCINSWKSFLPEYEIMLWNEDTFDISSCQFVKESYELGKYAFVSDYVRFFVLDKYGGIYLDTDVEFLKELDEKILENECVLALDDLGYLSGSTIMSENSNIFIKDCKKIYEDMPFINSDGSINNDVINTHMQNILIPFGYDVKNEFQNLNYKNSKIIIYPDEYFHCRSQVSGKLNKTSSTYAIHWHTITWTSYKTRLVEFLRINLLVPILGKKTYRNLTKKIKKGKTYI